METTYQDIIAQKRAAYEAKRAELEKELIELKERFDDERRTINNLCNHPTKKSIDAHRKQNAYNIKRFIGGKLSEWDCPYLNGADAVVGFEIKEDKLVFNVEVPFKHSAYEDQLDLF